MNRLFLLVLCFSILSFPTMLFSQNGQLDVSFGNNGKVTTLVGNAYCQANDILLLPNGKILVGGYAYSSQSHNDFSLACYNSNGLLDNTFGTGGKVVIDYMNTSNSIVDLCLLSSGKILAIGNSYYTSTNTNDFMFVRYNPDGTVDNSFGNNGIVSTDFEGRVDVPFHAVETNNGEIIVIGESRQNGNSKLVVARYHQDMTLDTTFGNNGYYLSPSGNSEHGRKIHLTNSGKILIAGHSFNSGISNDFTLWRLDSNGILDTAFGTGGKITTDFFQYTDNVSDMEIRPNGKIILAGYTSDINPSAFKLALAQYNSDGTLDVGFGNNGKIAYDHGQSTDPIATSLDLMDNGGAVVAGKIFNNNSNLDTDFGLLFIKPDGSIDTSYGNNGWVLTTFGGQHEVVTDMTIQSDHKIIAVGFSNGSSNNSYQFVMARYETEGSLQIVPVSKNISSINVYPNPVANTLNISFEPEKGKNLSIDLFDSNMRKIKTKYSGINVPATQKSISMELFSNLQPGIYILKIGNTDKVSTYKIVKK